MPAYPWQIRPDDHPLTADEVCEALSDSNGDVTRAAQRLKVGSLTLRKFIERSPRARLVATEMDRRVGDRARSKLIEALDDDDHRRQDWAIRYVLNSQNARHLGYAPVEPPSQAQTTPNVNVIVQPALWQDGTVVTAGQVQRPADFKQLELHPDAIKTSEPVKE